MELFYVFNTWENATLGSGIFFKAQDDSVQNVMLDYWVNFANTGNPNGAGLVSWPEYQASTDDYMEIKATPVGRKGLRTAQSDLWDIAIGFEGCKSLVGVDEINRNDTFLVYPNPTNRVVTINPVVGNDQFFVNIFDFTGKKIFTGKNLRTIDLTRYPAGIYLMKIVKDEQVWQTKLIKQ